MSTVPKFHPQHLQYLDRTFPEQTALDTPDEMAYQRGKRAVLSHIKMLLNQQQQPGPNTLES